MIIFLSLYTAVIVAVLISHFVIKHSLDEYGNKVEKSKKYWEKVFEKTVLIKKKNVRKLYNPIYLASFFDYLCSVDYKESKDILLKNKALIIKNVRSNRNITEQAYFMYCIALLDINRDFLTDDYIALFFELLMIPSVYLRENALKVFNKIGNEEYVNKALIMLSDKHIYHNEKLVEEGFMSFSKNKYDLADRLTDNFELYDEVYKVSVINFFTHSNIHEYDDYFCDYAENVSQSVDVICSIIRLISKNPTNYNRNTVTFLIYKYERSHFWEILTVAFNCLASYEPNDFTKELLLRNLSSRNYYVRNSIAKTMVKLGLVEEIDRILEESDDAYAKEALEYALEG